METQRPKVPAFISSGTMLKGRRKIKNPTKYLLILAYCLGKGNFFIRSFLPWHSYRLLSDLTISVWRKSFRILLSYKVAMSLDCSLMICVAALADFIKRLYSSPERNCFTSMDADSLSIRPIPNFC